MDPGPDAALVRRLLQEQAPSLAALPVRRGDTTGSSNWVFRLGDDLAVRLPRTDGYAEDLRAELRWLPRVGPALDVPVPEVVVAGEPSAAFARPWAVVSWLAGETPLDLDADRQRARAGETPLALDADRQRALAGTLGAFLRSLHDVDVTGVAADGGRRNYRTGEPVTDTVDRWLESAADQLADLLDPDAVRRAWSLLRDVPPPSVPPCWVHTDLAAENLLVDGDSRLCGVIDFGGLAVGDPSVDLLYAWSLFDPPAREVLRAAAGADEATWLRARAWAFVGPGLLTVAHYRHSMPGRTALLLRMAEAVAAEVGVRLR